MADAVRACIIFIFRHVERSNQMLEERNDSYKYTATQSQTKILQLEQEKVGKIYEVIH